MNTALGSFVGLADYAGMDGLALGSVAASDLNLLQKALLAGNARGGNLGAAGYGDMSPLRGESLEQSLKTVTFNNTHIRLWREIDKLPAFNTVEEFNRLKSYGTAAGAFVPEGVLPESQDSLYERAVAYVKFMGVVGEVSHQAMVVKPVHGPQVGQEVMNKTLWLLQNIEKALFFGRSDMVSDEWDGFLRQVFDGVGVANLHTDLYDATDILKSGAETVIVDMRGGDLSEDAVEAGANYVWENYGMAARLYSAPKAISNFTKIVYPRERYNSPPVVDGRIGASIKGMETQNGPISFSPDIFLRSKREDGSVGPPAAPTSPKAPNAPTIAVSSVGADAKSMFKGADAGTYYYSVTAENRFGESVGSTAITGSPTSGDAVNITITDVPSANPTTAYRIYRSFVGAGSSAARQYVGRIAKGGATTAWVDRNWWLPGCTMAWMMAPNINYQSFKQLAPMLRIPLATIAPSVRWMQMLYGVPTVYTPKKNFVFINIKDY